MITAISNYIIKSSKYNLKNFPFQDYKIVQISDLHLGFSTPSKIVKELVDKTLEISPNLVVITGDLFEGDIYKFKQELEVFNKLTFQVDTYFIFGNHDCQYNSVGEVLELLKSLGIKILINESVWIGDEKKGFNLAGVTDYISIRHSHNYPKIFRPDIEKSLEHIKKDFPTILLSHRSILRYADPKYDIDLIISGHIHGGQIYPFGLLVLLFKEDSGEKLSLRTKKIAANRYIHVSKGLGCTRLPLRVFVPRELNLITLNPA